MFCNHDIVISLKSYYLNKISQVVKEVQVVKKFFSRCAICSIVMIFLLTGCSGSTVKESDLKGKTFQYELDGFGGEFIIKLNEDGTFIYYEGPLSSCYGLGNWSLKGNVLHLKDTIYQDMIKDFYFRVVDDGDLVFMQEDSDTFMFVNVADGERFQPLENQ